MPEDVTSHSPDFERPATLVVIFLRGGADGVNIVVPCGDSTYYRKRPSIAIPEPGNKSGALDLDGFFAFHPALGDILPLYQSGDLAVIHGAGSDDDTRSHFEAQDLMELRGSTLSNASGGWLGRHLRSRPSGQPGPLASISFGTSVAESLRGAPGASAVQSLNEFRLRGARKSGMSFQTALQRLYSLSNDPVAASGIDTFAVVEALDRVQKDIKITGADNAYPQNQFGRNLRELAGLIHAGVGVEVATVDLNGWDTHFVQGGVTGLQASLIEAFAQGLSAFHNDLGANMENVCVVAMTEFGRRIRQNASLGTDHGRGSVMFVSGGSVLGGKVYGQWPGLTDADLEGPGDLPVTTDYRSVLAEILERRCANPNIRKVFPAFTPDTLGLYDRTDTAPNNQPSLISTNSVA